MARLTAVLDANILFPAVLRDIFMQMAFDGLYQAKWSNDIHNEWIESLLKKDTNLERFLLERTKDKMNNAIRDSLVLDYESIIPNLNLPDKKDRHVLASAIKSNSSYIITNNLKDFPSHELSKYDVEAINPDDFMILLFWENPEGVNRAMQSVQNRLKNPPMPMEDYLLNLERQGLTKTINAIRTK